MSGSKDKYLDMVAMNEAQRDLSKFLIDWYGRHNLSYIEKAIIFNELVGTELKFARRKQAKRRGGA